VIDGGKREADPEDERKQPESVAKNECGHGGVSGV
jgi:hypothetical protein